MGTVSRHVAASPSDVWAVLADGWTYSNWVVGTSHMRAVDASWPAPGTRLQHATGAWPAVIRDETVVRSSDPDRELQLTAKGSAVGAAHITLRLEGGDGGTEVSITEFPVSGPGRWLANPLTDQLTRLRNVETLARLAAVAERRTPH